jgi:hypothetical protein
VRISPLKGIIPGKSSVDIEIEYGPSEPCTVVVEAELNTSQYGFVPLLISIEGSGQYKETLNTKKLAEIEAMKKTEEEKLEKKRKNLFRLRNTKGKNKSVVMEGDEEEVQEPNKSLVIETVGLEEAQEQEFKRR